MATLNEKMFDKKMLTNQFCRQLSGLLLLSLTPTIKTATFQKVRIKMANKRQMCHIAISFAIKIICVLVLAVACRKGNELITPKHESLALLCETRYRLQLFGQC